MNNLPSYSQPVAVGEMGVLSRATFISRTYAHLVAAIGTFTLLEVAYFRTGVAETIAQALVGVSWLWVIGGFVLVSWMASRMAHVAQSKVLQYAALAGFVAAESIIFVPLLFLANKVAPGAITSAAVVTFLGFAGLTLVVFLTRKDFSFLRGLLFWGGISALVLIVAGAIFGFALGTYFSVAMVALAGGAILYDTSNVLHHYPEDRYVAAALELFASVALLLWYVLRLFLSLSRR
jgi:FtsH-binding integral membrane protein